MVPEQGSPRDIFVGDLRREFILTSEDKWILEAPGGSLVYAAAGYLMWEKEQRPGILTRVGEDYPEIWLEDFQARGIDARGITVLPHAMDLRSCTILEGNSALCEQDPVVVLSRRGVSLPSELLGYKNLWPPKTTRTERLPFAIREAEISDNYKTATGAHICPLDYLSHSLLPAMLRGWSFSTITLDPCSSYMTPEFFGDFPTLIPGLTAIFPAEEDLRNLYKGKSVDLWEIASDLGHYGCELVIIKRGARGQFLYETNSGKKWEIPAYPARVVDPVGIGDTFCGGFLAGFRRSFDPLEAVLLGSVAASLKIEGHGAFFGLEALPGLAEARLEALRTGVREV
jgi:hypothetical protein